MEHCFIYDCKEGFTVSDGATLRMSQCCVKFDRNHSCCGQALREGKLSLMETVLANFGAVYLRNSECEIDGCYLEGPDPYFRGSDFQGIKMDAMRRAKITGTEIKNFLGALNVEKRSTLDFGGNSVVFTAFRMTKGIA